MVRISKIAFVLCLLMMVPLVWAQDHPTLNRDDSGNLSEVETRILGMINSYRKLNKLPEIPISRSLMTVAGIHAEDLMLNRPDTGICGLHSWSDKGTWAACCETDISTKSCFETKAMELASYKGKSVEMVFRLKKEMTGPNIFQMMEKSTKAMDIILQKGDYAKRPWKAIGAGISGAYAVIWFGEDIDNQTITPNSPVLDQRIPSTDGKIPENPDTRVTAPPTGGKHYVTINYSKTEKEAETIARKARKLGYQDVQVRYLKKYWRVVFGPYSSMPEADKVKRAVQKDYKDAWIIQDE